VDARASPRHGPRHHRTRSFIRSGRIGLLFGSGGVVEADLQRNKSRWRIGQGPTAAFLAEMIASAWSPSQMHRPDGKPWQAPHLGAHNSRETGPVVPINSIATLFPISRQSQRTLPRRVERSTIATRISTALSRARTKPAPRPLRSAHSVAVRIVIDRHGLQELGTSAALVSASRTTL